MIQSPSIYALIEIMGFCSKEIIILVDFYASPTEKKSKDGKKIIIASKYYMIKAEDLLVTFKKEVRKMIE